MRRSPHRQRWSAAAHAIGLGRCVTNERAVCESLCEPRCAHSDSAPLFAGDTPHSPSFGTLDVRFTSPLPVYLFTVHCFTAGIAVPFCFPQCPSPRHASLARQPVWTGKTLPRHACTAQASCLVCRNPGALLIAGLDIMVDAKQGSCGYGQMDSGSWPYFACVGISEGCSLFGLPGKGCGVCVEVQCVESGPVRGSSSCAVKY